MPEELKAKFSREIAEVWNKGNLDVADELWTSNVVMHCSPLPDMVGRSAYKGFIADFRKAFPDVVMAIDEMIGEGNTVIARYHWQATHTGQGAALAIPPTDKRVTVVGCGVTHYVDGKAVEAWWDEDLLGLMQQLGVVTPLHPHA